MLVGMKLSDLIGVGINNRPSNQVYAVGDGREDGLQAFTDRRWLARKVDYERRITQHSALTG